ncbi:MAG: hypothetical protein ACXACP_00150, partial [Candidatus Hodarchaeales archaeon]
FLTFRSVLLLDRLLNPGHDLRISNLIDFFSLPALLFIFHSFITIGILIDGDKWGQNNCNFKTVEVLLYGTGAIFLLCGHGAHIVANYLNLKSEKLGINRTYPEFSRELWFIDEILTHWILLIDFYFLIEFLVFLNSRVPSLQRTTSSDRIFIIGGSVLSGLLWAPLTVESEFHWWAIIFSSISNCIIVLKLREKLLSKSSFTNFKMIWAILLFNLFTLVGLILYYFLFGGFIQPSDLIKANLNS